MPIQSATLAKKQDEHESGEQPASRIAAESESAPGGVRFDETQVMADPISGDSDARLEGTENINVQAMLKRWNNWMGPGTELPEATEEHSAMDDSAAEAVSDQTLAPVPAALDQMSDDESAADDARLESVNEQTLAPLPQHSTERQATKETKPFRKSTTKSKPPTTMSPTIEPPHRRLPLPSTRNRRKSRDTDAARNEAAKKIQGLQGLAFTSHGSFD